jgi:hypothetical protein
MNQPIDILRLYPVRKTKKQKLSFQEDVISYFNAIGYDAYVEKGNLGVRNIVAGNPENARYLITAHYDTCAVLPFPNLITPCSLSLFLTWQVFLVILLCVPVGIIGGLIGGLLDNAQLGILIAYCLVLAELGWMMFGPANRHNANDNTSGIVTLLEILSTLPDSLRKDVCFVLFDMEEAGLVGSAVYRKLHKAATENQIVLNLDCVGDGDHLRMFPTKALRKNPRKLTSLYKACGYMGKKNLLVQEKGKYLFPSDQMVFPYGVGICAMNKRKKWLYLSRIHTRRDTVLDKTNVNILRAALTTYICRDAVQ